MKVIRMTLFLLALISQLLAFGDAKGSLPPILRIEKDYSEEGQKPVIDSISEPIYQLDGYNFTLEFTVYFHGTNRIQVKLEEEYDYNMRVYTVEGDSIAHVKTDKMSALFYSWVHIVATNKYGSTKYTIEIPPYFPDDDDAVEEVTDQNPEIAVKGSTLSIKCNSELNVTVNTIDGKTVYNNRISQDTEFPLESGIFILTCGNPNISYTKKIMIR